MSRSLCWAAEPSTFHCPGGPVPCESWVGGWKGRAEELNAVYGFVYSNSSPHFGSCS